MARLASNTAAAQTSSYDYYIGPQGSDSNAGTQSAPWAITALNTMRALYAGKRVGVLPGTYKMMTAAGGSFTTGSEYVAQYCIAGGDATHQTIIQSTVPQGAILDAESNASNNPIGIPPIGCFGASPWSDGSLGGTLQGYITVDGFEIINAYNNSIGMMSINGAGTPSQPRIKNIVIQNCFIHAQTGAPGADNPAAITLCACDNALISNCLITDLQDTTNRSSGIDIWTSINCTVEKCTIISTHPSHNGGILVKNAAQGNATIRYNYIDLSAAGTTENGMNGGIAVDCDGDELPGGEAAAWSKVYNNIVIADQPVRPAVINTGAFPNSPHHQYWYNNTFVGIPDCSIDVFYSPGGPGTVTFYNNILQRGKVGYGGDVGVLANSPALWDYNLYPPSPSFVTGVDLGSPVTYGSLAAWQAHLATVVPSVTGRDAHSLTTNSPGFAGTGSGPARYKLASGSPSINAGTSDGTVNGTACDLGAWGNGATRIGADIGLAPAPNPPLQVTVT